MQNPAIKLNAPKNILIRAPNPIGDLIMATASFADIRKRFPEAHITMLVRGAQAKVLVGSDFFDELMIDDSARGFVEMFRLARRLWQQRFDFCVLYTNSLRTAFIVALAGIPERVGFAKGGQSLFLTQVIKPILNEQKKWLPMPMPEIYGRLSSFIGAEPGNTWPQLTVTETCEARARDLKKSLGIDDHEKLIGLAPGAAFGQSKLWPPGHFAALADKLTEKYGLRTIILSGPGEEANTRAMVTAMKSKPVVTDKPVDLDLLKPFIRDLALLIATDSGPRHFATAFRVPTVVVMGPTDPRWSGANLDRQEVVRHDVSCGPCHKKICPLDHRCMIGITPDEVMGRIAQLDSRLGIFGTSLN